MASSSSSSSSAIGSSDRDSLEDSKRDMLESANVDRESSGNLGGLTTFGAEHGYLEAMLRGFKSGFLKSFEYRQLCQCETLEDVKLCLGDTDYMNVLASTSKLTPEIILKKCEDKFVHEFQFLQSQAVGPLAVFLDFITYEDLISNISFLITSMIKGSDPATLLPKCLPLGKSPHLQSVLTFDNLDASGGDGLVELYRTVLVDTPVAPYFEKYFNSAVRSDQPSAEIQRAYNETEIDIITNMLQKLWLEDFHRYCTEELGGETGQIMGELLAFEADRRAISITRNSFRTNLNEPSSRDNERKKLYCCFGSLYPEATLFSFSKVGDETQLLNALEPYKLYADLLRQGQDLGGASSSAAGGSASGKSFEDLLYEHEVSLMTHAFDGQSHFACFYAWVQLKKQELRNIKWILSCINQKRDQKDFNKWIKIF